MTWCVGGGVHARAQEVKVNKMSFSLPPLLLTESICWLYWLVLEPQGPLFLTFTSVRIPGAHYWHGGFLRGFWETELSLHWYTASTLQSEPSPKLFFPRISFWRLIRERSGAAWCVLMWTPSVSCQSSRDLMDLGFSVDLVWVLRKFKVIFFFCLTQNSLPCCITHSSLSRLLCPQQSSSSTWS